MGIPRQARDPSKLAFPQVHGKDGAARTLLRFSLRWEGVRLYNSLPKFLRQWEGTKESFKNKFDQFLTLITDEPELPNAKPGGLTLDRKPSNSIPDWIRTLMIILFMTWPLMMMVRLMLLQLKLVIPKLIVLTL